MHFYAKWRAETLKSRPFSDWTYCDVKGKGVFVGDMLSLTNPVSAWWGEGDEKILVDGEKAPSIFGTGSEDYFNYSWSRADLFAHPFCGQPLDSGPDTSGYVSNHRFQILDAVPFDRSLAVFLELWGHTPTPGTGYARIAYYYALPDSIDDHRGLMPGDMRLQKLPKRPFAAMGGATGAKSFSFDDLKPTATAGRVETVPMPLAYRHQVVNWKAEKGAKLKFSLPTEKDGRVTLHLVAVHQPGGAVLQAALDGKPLPLEGGAKSFALRSAFAPRDLNVNFQPVEAKAGTHEIELECIEAGPAGLDLIWARTE